VAARRADVGRQSARQEGLEPGDLALPFKRLPWLEASSLRLRAHPGWWISRVEPGLLLARPPGPPSGPTSYPPRRLAGVWIRRSARRLRRPRRARHRIAARARCP